MEEAKTFAGETDPLNGYQIEKYSAGHCVRNPHNEYLWYGSSDGEEDQYFFTAGKRTTKFNEYDDCKTIYANTVEKAVEHLQAWMKQVLDEDNSIPPMEIYRFK